MTSSQVTSHSSLLGQSGHLFEMHAQYRGFHWAARALEIRHRQLRRAIRRQRLVVFLLSFRLYLRPGRAVGIPQAKHAIYLYDEKDGGVRTVAVGAIPKCIAVKLWKPKRFSVLPIRGVDWLVIASHRFLFWHIVELNKKLN